MARSRQRKIAEEIKKIVSRVIMQEIKDPKVTPLCSVTHVEVTSDLRYATLYIGIFDPKHSIEEQIEGLNRAKGFIRREIGNHIKAHYTPEPIFKPDTSAEYGMRIGNILSALDIRQESQESETASEDSRDDEVIH